MSELFHGANPLMLFLLGIVGLICVVAIPCWIVGALVDAVQWCRGKVECGWGWWLNDNTKRGWCHRRKLHFGEHQ